MEIKENNDQIVKIRTSNNKTLTLREDYLGNITVESDTRILHFGRTKKGYLIIKAG